MAVPSAGPHRSLQAALMGLAAALPAALWLWDFTVDDAWIGARYAVHIAEGLGYRFNPTGPSTDGVTPLGWPYLLAPFGKLGVVGTWRAAKLLGLLCWLGAAAALGLAMARVARSALKWSALVLVASSAPLAAWSVAGMETGLVLSLGALAAAGRVLGKDRLMAACAALLAAWRPEALPWAVVLALGPSRVAPPFSPRSSSPAELERALRSKLVLLGLVLAPVLLVLAVRWLAFGHPLPLALRAKPPDALLGARYALACFLLTGPPALLAWRRLPAWCRGLQLAVAVHFGAVALAGGDWMPLSRLVVPVLPSVALAAGCIVATSWRPLGLARLGLAIAGQIFVLVRVGPSAAAVGPKRLAIIEQLAPVLRDARAVASLDVGWVGAATNTNILDLAGVTDPAVAALPGGHTSQRIPPSLLSARQVDTVVLLLGRGEPVRDPWFQSRFARLGEHRLAMTAEIRDGFVPVAVGSSPPLTYLVLRDRAHKP